MIGFAAHLTADPPQYCTPKAKQAGQCSRCHRSTIKDCSICLDRMRFCCISSSRTTRHRLHQEPALLQEATDPLHRICTERTPGSLHVAAAHHVGSTIGPTRLTKLGSAHISQPMRPSILSHQDSTNSNDHKSMYIAMQQQHHKRFVSAAQHATEPMPY